MSAVQDPPAPLEVRIGNVKYYWWEFDFYVIVQTSFLMYVGLLRNHERHTLVPLVPPVPNISLGSSGSFGFPDSFSFPSSPRF